MSGKNSAIKEILKEIGTSRGVDEEFQHAKYIKILQELYDESEDEAGFLKDLQHFLIVPLMEERKNMQKQVDIVFSVVAALKIKQCDVLVRYAVRGSKAENKTVRGHSVQLLHQLLNALPAIPYVIHA